MTEMEMPPVGEVVRCKLQSASGKEVEADLIHVDEDDVTWRTADDRSELDEWSWDVISWSAIPAPGA